MIKEELFDTEELLYLAIDASKKGNTDKCFELLKSALEKEPENARVTYMLGAMYAEIGMYERAVDYMQKAVGFAPELYVAHFQLGLLHLTSGNLIQAKQTWSALDSLGEEHALYLFKRGIEALAENKFQECISDLTRGIELNTENMPLNKDMQLLITQAQQALSEADNQKSDEAGAKATGGHVFMNVYNESDENQ